MLRKNARLSAGIAIHLACKNSLPICVVVRHLPRGREFGCVETNHAPSYPGISTSVSRRSCCLRDLCLLEEKQNGANSLSLISCQSKFSVTPVRRPPVPGRNTESALFSWRTRGVPAENANSGLSSIFGISSPFRRCNRLVGVLKGSTSFERADEARHRQFSFFLFNLLD